MIFRALILRAIAEAILDYLRGRKLMHEAWIVYNAEARTIRSGEIRTIYVEDDDG